MTAAQTPTLFDGRAAQTAADIAVDTVDTHATPEFRTAAMAAIARCAARTPTLTSDDVWVDMAAHGGIPATPDNRALGAVMRRAATDGLIAATNELRPSQRVSLHGSPRRIWRSLVFGAGGAKEVRS